MTRSKLAARSRDDWRCHTLSVESLFDVPKVKWLVRFNSAFDSDQPQTWLVDSVAYEKGEEVAAWLIDSCDGDFAILRYRGHVIFEREDDARLCYLTFA
jgi:hypothetical protein